MSEAGVGSSKSRAVERVSSTTRASASRRALGFDTVAGMNRWPALLAAAAVLVGCAGPTPRDPAVVAAIETGAERYAAERRQREDESLQTFIERFEAVARGETPDNTFDALLFSGGAEWGAFGAGYTAQWAELGEAAAVPMPAFDFIGGISTGALMAAYVASGKSERYASLEEFYRNVSPDWIEMRPLLSLLSKRTISLVDNEGVREQVAMAVDDALITDLRQAHAEGLQVAVGTVNLDYGGRRYWDVAKIAAENPEPKERIVDVLMAATSIAGVFPPVEIDGALYGDLGYVEGIPAFQGRGLPAFEELWRQRNGDTLPPLMRLWLVYNIAIGVVPEPVELSLVPIALSGYDALVQATFTNPVNTALLLERVTAETRTPEIEVRWIGIPPDFEPPEDSVPFDPKTANPLADIGREMARLPDGGWRRDPPD